ncbi:prepilin peptidase (plasmid) [Streptomyces sp. SDT5-1]|uniref:prepilin peptidase n=1 Tax=Streptomyces sp. SDT5-1 TaxID=3406418 RepID=UPI003FD407C3
MWTSLAAIGWGAAAGWLMLPALYRLSVPTGTPWHASCPDGHPLRTGPRGWLAGPRCPQTAHACVSRRATTAVTTASAAVCGLLAAVTGPRPELLVWLLLAPLALLLALVDARVHRLPDVLTLPLAAAALALLGPASLAPDAAGSWTTALLAAATLGGLFLVLFVISPRSMGFGDVKLALGIGAVLGWYGWRVLILGVFAGYLIAAAHGMTLLIRRKATARTALAIGPSLLTGALVGVALGAAAG